MVPQQKLKIQAKKTIRLKTLLVSLVAFFSCLAFANDQVSPVEELSVMGLLEKMAIANRELSYKGIFTYEHGGALKTIEVNHAVKDGMEYEKLTHLNGPVREVIRHGKRLDCQRVGDMLLRGMGSELDNAMYSHLEDHYNLYIKGENRVANRDVTEIHVVPKDKYRYGYSLSIDKQTGLLLQSMLIDRTNKGNRVMERFQFVQLEVGALINEADVMPGSGDHMVASVESLPCVGEASEPSSQRQWRAAWLPPGFAFAGYQPRTEKSGEALIYTDGLAVFSVFVDSAEQVGLPEVEARRGATFAYLIRQGIDNRDFLICVVGEIPTAVAKQVAHSVTPLQ